MKYIKELLTNVGMQDAKSICIPMIVGLKLSKYAGDVMGNPYLYRQIVGAL